MTFVGKILVIVIMVFSLLFLGISTVVFVDPHQLEDGDRGGKEEGQRPDLQDPRPHGLGRRGEERRRTRPSPTTRRRSTRSKAGTSRSKTTIKTAEAEVTAARSKLEVAQESAKPALAEAAENRKETEQLRDQKSEVEKQANEYKLQQTELNDKIREHERQIKTLDDNNKDLRDRVARLLHPAPKNGLSDDITTVKGLESPPAVQGEVARVDAKNTQVEITIGSDDGIVAGHELFVYRTKPQAQYLGKIKILSVDPDQAVGQVIGRTVNGIKIKEGDIVSSTIRPAELAPRAGGPPRRPARRLRPDAQVRHLRRPPRRLARGHDHRLPPARPRAEPATASRPRSRPPRRRPPRPSPWPLGTGIFGKIRYCTLVTSY